jgi:thymidylate synthase ThyX
MISAEIIADSLNSFGDRLTTFKLTMPRIVLAEFNTHRMISRNSASSRAIPFETILKRVKETPFIPLKWQKDHKGMQGSEYLEFPSIGYAEEKWLEARDEAIRVAEYLSNTEGVTKQLCNRLLEPFMWHTVIATATDWENFFALRAHHMAEIHIQDLAYKMLDEYNQSQPEALEANQWHIPFAELINIDEVHEFVLSYYKGDSTSTLQEAYKVMAKISAGICAGVSYGRIKDKIDLIDMIDLYESLVQRPYEGKRGTRILEDPIHASPTEHQARAMSEADYFKTPGSELGRWSGNFYGFVQFRKTLSNENASDNRVNKRRF